MERKNELLIVIAILVVVFVSMIYFTNFDDNLRITDKDDFTLRLNDIGATISSVDNVVTGNNKFALDYYNQIKDKEENIFFSPYSISTALAMVYEGAKGETADQIRSIFYFPENDELRRPSFAKIYNDINEGNEEYLLNTANALWAQKDYTFLEDYLNTISVYYGGKTTNLDFVGETEKSRQTINVWVEEKTNNKIKNLIPAGFLNSMTRMVLTNAIYFKGKWVKQFDEEKTREEDFTTDNGKVKVQMMRLLGEDAKFKYTETNDLQILELPYEGDKLSMLIMLPKEDLKSVEKDITVDNLNSWTKELIEQRVDVYLPKFTFETKYFMSDDLIDMGMTVAFSEGADFSGMDGTRNLFIDFVIHQAFVEVNEEGTEAAAATAVGMRLTAMPGELDYKIFKADHPFIFVIQEKENGNILFLGRMSDPSA